MSSWVSLILTLKINAVFKGSVNILKANLAFRKNGELETGSYIPLVWNQLSPGNVGMTTCCIQHKHIGARVFPDLPWTTSRGLGKAYEMNY